MNKTLKAIFISIVLLYSFSSYATKQDPQQVGAFIGPIPVTIDFSLRNGYPTHYGTWAGNVFLYSKKVEVQEWIIKKKIEMTKKALNEARSYAKKNNYTFYAVDNIQYQITHTENKIELFFDGNVIAWK